MCVRNDVMEWVALEPQDAKETPKEGTTHTEDTAPVSFLFHLSTPRQIYE